mmetsp:Transcript_8151/g.24230  ORF Transcript_8151/g.24230 Transcript_8151/m.24230 type:complete len:527 (+) Transcript_8151:544-2124(+)
MSSNHSSTTAGSCKADRGSANCVHDQKILSTNLARSAASGCEPADGVNVARSGLSNGNVSATTASTGLRASSSLALNSNRFATLRNASNALWTTTASLRPRIAATVVGSNSGHRSGKSLNTNWPTHSANCSRTAPVQSGLRSAPSTAARAAARSGALPKIASSSHVRFTKFFTAMAAAWRASTRTAWPALATRISSMQPPGMRVNRVTLSSACFRVASTGENVSKSAWTTCSGLGRLANCSIVRRSPGPETIASTPRLKISRARADEAALAHRRRCAAFKRVALSCHWRRREQSCSPCANAPFQRPEIPTAIRRGRSNSLRGWLVALRAVVDRACSQAKLSSTSSRPCGARPATRGPRWPSELRVRPLRPLAVRLTRCWAHKSAQASRPSEAAPQGCSAPPSPRKFSRSRSATPSRGTSRTNRARSSATPGARTTTSRRARARSTRPWAWRRTRRRGRSGTGSRRRRATSRRRIAATRKRGSRSRATGAASTGCSTARWTSTATARSTRRRPSRRSRRSARRSASR